MRTEGDIVGWQRPRSPCRFSLLPENLEFTFYTPVHEYNFFAFTIVSWPGSWVGRRDFLADPSGKNFNCSQTKSEILALKNKRIQRAYISFLSCNETALVENLMVKKNPVFIRALPLLSPISELYHSSAVCVPKQVQQYLRLVFAVRKAANRQTVITHDG